MTKKSIAMILSLLALACMMTPDVCAGDIKVMNSGKDFSKFWSMQKGLNADEKVDLFERLVISKYEEAYYVTVFKGQERDRREIIKAYLWRIDDINAREIIDFADRFDRIAEKQVRRFKGNFRNVAIETDVYGIIGFDWFWGKMVALKGNPNNLAFDIARLKDLDDRKLNIIFAHELVHSIHLPSMGITSIATLLQGMWTEGFASYVSGKLNGSSDAETVLGRINAAKCEDLPAVIQKFRPVMYGKMTDLQEKKWLSANGPAYCLGFHVVKHLNRKHSMDEMISWKMEELTPHVEAALSVLQPRLGVGAVEDTDSGGFHCQADIAYPQPISECSQIFRIL